MMVLSGSYEEICKQWPWYDEMSETLKALIFHGRVLINGHPEIGKGTTIGQFSEIYDRGGIVQIGKGVDIASFVSINCADSHRKCMGLSDEIELLPIVIEDNVFIGSHCFIPGGTHIGHHSTVGAGVVLPKNYYIEPWSLVHIDSTVTRTATTTTKKAVN